MSAKELLEMTSSISSAVTDTQAIRDKIFAEFDAATTEDQRCSLLAMFKATMDVAESWVAAHGTVEELAKLREARADDYTKLLVKESTIDGSLEGTLSPELFMAVTNREIAAGRLSPDDPIRQAALKAAGSPHPSHDELLAQAEAKKRSDMSIQALIDELTTTKSFDVVDARAKIQKEFDAAATSEQRGQVLAIFKATLDAVERNLTARGEGELLENISKARAQDYKIFIVQECTVGLDTPVVGGDISVDMLMAVTNREIAAGRMTEDHPLRKLAVEGAAAPHLSHAELMAKHAKLRAEAGAQSSAPAPKAAADSSQTAYAFGTVLGRKLKGLFRK